MVAMRGLTETVQEVIDQIPEHKGRTVEDLIQTEEGADLIDRILLEMRTQKILQEVHLTDSGAVN